MKVLFLCSSNVFRSQMAEAFFNRYFKKDKAESAALIRPQEKMHSLVVRAMKERGIDISKNKSKKISKEIIDRADLIVLMDKKLKGNLNFNKNMEVWNIEDVIAKETDEHLYFKIVEARDKIEEKVKELVKRINNNIFK